MPNYRAFKPFALVVTLSAVMLVAASMATPARANTELDHLYSLETVGVLRAYDNVDGLFGDYALSAYKEFFSHQSRFVFQDLTKADAVLAKAKIPYFQLIDDPKILAQIARATRTQTIVRTKIRKEGPQYQVTIDWLHAPQMDLLASDTAPLEGGAEVGNLREAIDKGMARVIAKLPFLGHVTGRDGDSVTVNIGANANLAPGDELEIGTIEEAKRHPLLHAIVDWRIARIGRITVEKADEGIAFCKLTQEEPGKSIARYQKITQIIPHPITAPVKRSRSDESTPDSAATGPEDLLNEPPHLGYVSAALSLGSYSRDYNSADNVGRSGSSGLVGGKLEGQLWLTGAVFGDLALDYSSGTYTQKDTQTGAATPSSGVGASLSHFRIDGGYTFLGAGSMTSAKGSVRAGYKSDSYSLPTATTPADGATEAELTGSVAFKSFFVGVGGDIPFAENYGAEVNLDFGILNSITESGLNSGDSNGSSNVAVSLAGYYRYRPRLSFRLGVDIVAQGADFATNKNLSHKSFQFLPGVAYYF